MPKVYNYSFVWEKTLWSLAVGQDHRFVLIDTLCAKKSPITETLFSMQVRVIAAHEMPNGRKSAHAVFISVRPNTFDRAERRLASL